METLGKHRSYTEYTFLKSST
ncbi:hypothetical protein EYZ11_000967 [Aspergillus tanneri]|uniref:Uncharacterized protein n=1 Tax=Aspergillus tanneri TaxID=1220188 RepID=A0A4S3JVW6_9EURO|nr:hypothetical protein EYZ11_000967 [Aspergillus tanneri]